MKLMGFERGVTVQGGLPIPVTTPATAPPTTSQGVAFANVGAMKMRSTRLAAWPLDDIPKLSPIGACPNPLRRDCVDRSRRRTSKAMPGLQRWTAGRAQDVRTGLAHHMHLAGLAVELESQASPPLINVIGSARTWPLYACTPFACFGHRLNEKRRQCLVTISGTSPAS